MYSSMMDGVTMRKRARKTAGLTMVELMIALIIMAIAMLGVVSVMLHTMKAKELTREYDIAKEAAFSKLEGMRALNWVSENDNTGPYLSDMNSTIYDDWSIAGLNHTTTADKKGKGSIVVFNKNDVTNFNENLLDVEVTIEWIGIDGVRKHSVRSMFTR